MGVTLIRGDKEIDVQIPAGKENTAMGIRSVNLNFYDKLEVESFETPSLLGHIRLNSGDIIQAVNGQKTYSQYQFVYLKLSVVPVPQVGIYLQMPIIFFSLNVFSNN